MNPPSEIRSAAILANTMGSHLNGHRQSRAVLALAMVFGQFPAQADVEDPAAMFEAMVGLARQQLKTRLLANQMHASGLGDIAPMAPL
ncbi:MAG: hypothetical protein K5Q68_14915 [Roseococcus sp.]|nr:hypothetical protein [Roseococcus sp.]